MSTKTMKEHRDYPDAEAEYDGADPDYDDTEGGSDLDGDPDRCDAVDTDSGFPAPDVFPETLFNDIPRQKAGKAAPGHGDS